MQSTSNFPKINIPEKDKNEDYHMKWVRAIVSNTFTESWANNYQVMEMLYKYYLDGSSGDLTGYLQTAPDGSSLPAIWLSLNGLKSNLDLLVGQMEETGYEIKVKALNKEAISRKLEEKERLRVERKLQAIAEYAFNETGIPLQKPEYIPQTDQELNEYIDLTFKDKAEVIMESALKFTARYSNWDEKRKALFRDVLITNRSIVRNEIVRGLPTSRRIDPLKFIFDPNSTDDMLSDSTYFGEVEYMPLAAAAEQYGLDEEEIQKAYNSYNEFLGLNPQSSSSFSSDFSFMPGQRIKWFKIMDGTPRCLVLRGVWRDIKTLKHKSETVEKYGMETNYVQDVTGEYTRERDKDSIIENKIQCWRQGTLIGGCILKEWGEVPNQPRDLSSFAISEPPYQVWVPNFLMGKSVSKLEQLVGLQLLKDIAMYQVQLAMARSGPKGLVVDMAMMPQGTTKEQITSHIKSDGLVFLNSMEYMSTNMGAGLNLFKDFDMSLSESVGQYFQIMQYIDAQIASISGVTPERQGIVQGASAAVGVTQAALIQSNLVTAPYFKGFERFCSRVLNHQAKLIKIAWANKEMFAPIIGDTGIDFLREHIDLDLDEFGVFVDSAPPMLRDRQALEETLNLYLQTSQGDPQVLADVLDIRLEPDTKVAIRKFQRKIALRIKMQQEMQQQQMQQEQQMQEAQMAQQEQMSQQELNNLLQLQQMKNQGNMQKTLATGRVKLNSEKLRLLNKP